MMISTCRAACALVPQTQALEQVLTSAVCRLQAAVQQPIQHLLSGPAGADPPLRRHSMPPAPQHLVPPASLFRPPRPGALLMPAGPHQETPRQPGTQQQRPPRQPETQQQRPPQGWVGTASNSGAVAPQQVQPPLPGSAMGVHPQLRCCREVWGWNCAHLHVVLPGCLLRPWQSHAPGLLPPEQPGCCSQVQADIHYACGRELRRCHGPRQRTWQLRSSAPCCLIMPGHPGVKLSQLCSNSSCMEAMPLHLSLGRQPLQPTDWILALVQQQHS